MEAGGVCVARSLAIDAALVRDVLIRLRRDVAGGVARWTLGGHGVAEIDVDFFPTVAPAGDERPAWSSTAAPRGSRWRRERSGGGRDLREGLIPASSP